MQNSNYCILPGEMLMAKETVHQADTYTVIFKHPSHNPGTKQSNSGSNVPCPRARLMNANSKLDWISIQ